MRDRGHTNEGVSPRRTCGVQPDALERARDISWERTGRETAAVYQEVYDEVRRRP